MISAEEALRKIKPIIADNTPDNVSGVVPINPISIEEIEAKINEAIDMKFDSITIRNKPSKEVIKILKSLGYHIYLFKYDCSDFMRTFNVKSRRPDFIFLKRTEYVTEISMIPKDYKNAYERL